MTGLNTLLFGVTAVLIGLNLVLLAGTVYWVVHGLSEKVRESRLARVYSPVRQRRPASRY